MERSKNVASVKPVDIAGTDDPKKAETEVHKQPSAEKAKVPPTAARRAPGTKEVIPFVWKLIGESRGAILTLFKSVERDEVESQFERLRRDGYYANLRILDVNEKVEQPASSKKQARAVKKITAKTTAKTSKAVRVTTKTARAKGAVKASRACKTAVTAKRAKKSKATPKKTRKKAASAKSTKKRSARKR